MKTLILLAALSVIHTIPEANEDIGGKGPVIGKFHVEALIVFAIKDKMWDACEEKGFGIGLIEKTQKYVAICGEDFKTGNTIRLEDEVEEGI